MPASEALVVDASVAAKWHLVDEDDADQAITLLARFIHGQTDLFAPDYIRYEVASAITAASLGHERRLSPDQGERAIRRFLSLGLRMTNTDDLILAAYALAHQYGCTLYDSLYLALAQELGLPLITADARFCKSVGDHPDVIWIGDYTPAEGDQPE